MVYDSLLVLACILFATGIAVAINGGESVPASIVAPLVIAVIVGFFSGFWRRGGQTLGMRAWRLRVQNADGSALSFSQSLRRLFAAALSLATLGAGYLWQWIDAERRCWADIASDSRTVLLPPKPRG